MTITRSQEIIKNDISTYATATGRSVPQVVQTLSDSLPRYMAEQFDGAKPIELAWVAFSISEKKVKTVDIGEHKGIQYNARIWEPIDVPEDMGALSKSFHYIGPIIAGKVVEPFPFSDIPDIAMYKTYAGLEELTHAPIVDRLHTCKVFENCPNIKNFVDIGAAWQRFSGTSNGPLFADSNISALAYPDKSIDLPDKGQLTQLLYVMIHNYLSVDDPDLSKLPKHNLTIPTVYGNVISIEFPTKASEMNSDFYFQREENLIFASTWRPIHGVSYHDLTVYVIDVANFDNDTSDPRLFEFSGVILNKDYDKGFIVNKDAVVTLTNNVTIKSSGIPAIDCCGDVVIKGNGHALTLIQESEIQPCIGPCTNDGLSYGRWSPAPTILKSITLIDCYLVLQPANKSFSIGNYGLPKVPEIILEGSSTFEAPEAHGERRMTQSGLEGIAGSTKRTKPALYEIL